MADDTGITEVHDLGRHFFGPVGSCIYCARGGATTPLSSEHILSFALGGNAELEEASCPSCAKLTQSIERYCFSKIFGDFLVLKGIQTRNPKARKNIVRVEFEFENGAVETEVPVENTLSALVLPQMSPPRLMDNSAPIKPFNIQGLSAAFSGDIERRIQQMRPAGAKSYKYKVDLDFLKLNKFLAKTALAGAVAFFGYDHRKSFLPKLILSDNVEESQNLIGGLTQDTVTEFTCRNTKQPSNQDQTYISFQMAGNGTDCILVCNICFFVAHGCSVYQIIVGPIDCAFDLTVNPPRTARLPRKARNSLFRGQ